MRLKSVILENFRGYGHEVRVPLDTEITGFVGRNDAGKSTILEALEVFFNNDVVKIEPGDLHIGADSSFITIGCVFDNLPDPVILDENHHTNLTTEYLTNSDGDLEVRKKYKVQATVGKPTISLRALHPTADYLDNLHSMKISDLKRLGKERGVEDNVADWRVASLWRIALWESTSDLVLTEKDIEVGGMDKAAKSIYERIELLFPAFALFKSDRESSDVDPEAKNPMQAAVKQAQQEYAEEIEELQGKIEKAVLEVANRTRDKIQEMDPNLASQLTPRFKDKPKWTFNFTLDGEDGVPINKRGSGARRLILLNFFRAEAEKRRSESGAPRVIYAIEEPETSQHPSYQMMLIRALMHLAARSDCQIIVTTHVPGLAGLLPVESLRFVTQADDGSPVIKSGDDKTLEETAASLGVLPESGIESAGAVLLVEGHSDVTFIHHTADALKENGYVECSLRDANVAAIPIGGCGNLKHWVTKRLVEQLGLEWGVLMDSDIGDEVESQRNARKAEEVRAQGRKVWLTRKREPENYIDPEIVATEKGVQVSYTDTCDAKKLIATAAGIRKDDVLERLWPKMTAEKMVAMSTYADNGEERVELVEIVEGSAALAQ